MRSGMTRDRAGQRTRGVRSMRHASNESPRHPLDARGRHHVLGDGCPVEAAGRRTTLPMQVTFLRGAASLPLLLGANAAVRALARSDGEALAPARAARLPQRRAAVVLRLRGEPAVAGERLLHIHVGAAAHHGAVGADAGRARRLAAVARGARRPDRRHHRAEAERRRTGHDRRTGGAGFGSSATRSTRSRSAS